MYLLAEKKVLIERDAAEVFAFAADLENFAKWFPGVMAIMSGDGRPFNEVGKSYTEFVRLPFARRAAVTVRVRQCRNNEFIATEGNFKPLFPRMEMEFHQVASGTRVTWRMHSRARGLVTRRVLIPVARRIMNRRADSAMAELKMKLERNRAFAERT